MSLRTWCSGICIAVVFGMLVGCGGGATTAAAGASSASGSAAGSSSSGGSSSGGSTPIQGVATPSSVSVVTATNAN